MDIDAILAGPEYFYCEREHCTLRYEVCLKRQRANQEHAPFLPVPYLSCENCAQGLKNRLLKGNIMEPRRGKGERSLTCENYDECLDIAAQKDWGSFNCESCPLFKPAHKEVPAKQQNTRICKLCGIRPTIQPSSPYCSVCLALKGKEARARKKEASHGASKPGKERRSTQAALKTEKGPTQSIQEEEIVDAGANMELVLKFGKYGHLLKEIERLAEEEVRPVELQVIYMLKRYLSNGEAVKSI